MASACQPAGSGRRTVGWWREGSAGFFQRLSSTARPRIFDGCRRIEVRDQTNGAYGKNAMALRVNMERLMETTKSARGRSAGSRATQFKPGHPGRKKRVAPQGPQPPTLLLDLRRLYRQDESK